MKVAIVDLSDEGARRAALTVALSMYLGEQCKYCRREYKTLKDLEEAEVVYAGYHEHGRTACGACWRSNNPENAKP